MFGNVTALEGLHVTGKYRDRSMQLTCSLHAAWDPQRQCVPTSETSPFVPAGIQCKFSHEVVTFPSKSRGTKPAYATVWDLISGQTARADKARGQAFGVSAGSERLTSGPLSGFIVD